jgi:hypothetical protein
VITFTVQGPFDVPVYQGKAARTITPDEVKTFWTGHPAAAGRRGCYVFCIRAGGGVTPLYVGRATRSFKQEVFQPHKLAKYQQGLADYRKGTPVLFLISYPQKRGAPSGSAIAELEAFLIQSAIKRNPDLLNVKGTRKAEWAIAGVVRSGVGKPSKSARLLKSALSL